jgi:hypothetical protein
MQWSKTYGLSGNDCGTSIITSGDGGYTIAGYAQNPNTGAYSYLLFKTDSQGTQQWSNVFGGANSYAYSHIQTNDGGYALIGRTSHLGAGKNDFYLVKSDAEGALQWGTAYGGANDDVGYSIVQTNDGYAMAGYTSSFGENNTAVYYNGYLIKTDSNGITQWSKPLGGNSTDFVNTVIQLDDGSYALAGDTITGSYTSMQKDFFGNYKWYSSSSLWLIKIASDGSSPASPMPSPTPTPSPSPPATPTPTPTNAQLPTPAPTQNPTVAPTAQPINSPTTNPTSRATTTPTHAPTPTTSTINDTNPTPTIPELTPLIAIAALLALIVPAAILKTQRKHSVF